MGVIRVAFLFLWWYRVPRPMVPRRNLGPRVCCSHTLVPLGARWYLGMCESDSTALSRNPCSYPNPLPLNYLEESHHMSIASWLIKQESTQLMYNLEQECLEQKSSLILFRLIQSFLHYSIQWERLLISFLVKTRQCYPYLGICPLDKLT